MLLNELQGDQRKRISDHYETFLHSLALLRGDRLSADQVSRIVGEAVAGASPDELRSSVPPASAIGRLQQLLAQTVESGRPRNMYGADAARAAQAAGGATGQRFGGGLDAFGGRPGSSARYREISGDGNGKGGSGQSGTGSSATGSPVTAEFARSFAGTGMVGGTLRTFAEVGLDRGTFNEFRREGFSKEQIKDNAQDTKALGWKGKEDLSIAQHAIPEARKAAIAVEQAKTPEALAKAQEREAEVAKKVDAMPDSDPRKHGTVRFFKHVIKKSQHAERHKAIGVGAQEHDAAVAKDQAGPAKASHAAAQTQDGLMVKFDKQKTAVLSSGADDLLGSSFPSPSAPAKPAPVKVAAKPAAPHPSG